MQSCRATEQDVAQLAAIHILEDHEKTKISEQIQYTMPSPATMLI